jgi:undecaprenyl-diphosphatase
VPALLGWQDPGSAFSAAMQQAALAAVVSYFWPDVRGLASGSISAARRGDFFAWDFRFAVWIVLATIPGVIGGALLKSRLNTCGSPIRTLEVIGVACLVMGVLLAGAELICRHRRILTQMSLLDALVVGVAQVGALIPGVSRSGSTLTAALFLDLKRDEAARFSFLLGLPFIALAGVYELLQLAKAHLGAHGWSILLVGLIVGAISAFAAIWGLMRILERFSAWPFVIYRIVLGLVLLVGASTGWLS